jgi:hypothetical protein
MKLIILGFQNYDFTNSENKRITGSKVFYIDGKEDSPNIKGLLPIICNASPGVTDKFQVLPGLYDITFRHKSSFKGQPQLIISDANFLHNISIDVIEDE